MITTEVLLAVLNVVQVIALSYIAYLSKRTNTQVNGTKPPETVRDTR